MLEAAESLEDEAAHKQCTSPIPTATGYNYRSSEYYVRTYNQYALGYDRAANRRATP
eukprot:SAG22_NODE_2597_length_2402_cov_1.862788_1_plen_57_part_00